MIKHLGWVVVCVFDFEKALYFPGLPNIKQWNGDCVL